MSGFQILIRGMPVFLTILLIVWTKIVSPFSKYGDAWAIYPAFFIFPLSVLWHFGLVFFETQKIGFFIYGAVHTFILFYIWLYCLTMISKDAL
jgi:hypothetical protein